MNPQQALDSAAEVHVKKAVVSNEFSLAREKEKSFKAGALSPEAMRYWEMNSPAVDNLLLALERCRHGSNYGDAYDHANDALKAWDEREKCGI